MADAITGRALIGDFMNRAICDTDVVTGGKFCGKCGAAVPDTTENSKLSPSQRLRVPVFVGIAVLVLAVVAFRQTRRAEGELEVKVRTDFIAGNDTTFVDGLNVGIGNARMKKNFTENLIEVTFDFDTSKIKSDPSRSHGLLYKFYDANGKSVGHEQVEYEMSQNIISAASGGSRVGSVTHALDMVRVDAATLRVIDKASIGFLTPDQIRW